MEAITFQKELKKLGKTSSGFVVPAYLVNTKQVSRNKKYTITISDARN